MIGLGLPGGQVDVVCLAAHPDDVEIGCGGLLLHLGERPGTRIHEVVLTGTPERHLEVESALQEFAPGATLDVLDLEDGRLPARWDRAKQALEEVGKRVRADVVLAPRVDDLHQDHRLVGKLAATVWRDALVLHYEIPKWDADLRPSTHYVALDEETARRKFAVLDASFPSQHGRDWWDEETFLGLMRLRGVECRARYAEGFSSAKVLVGLDGARGGAGS